MNPRGGKGWRAGECEFCWREAVELFRLKSVPREVTQERRAPVLLRVGVGWRARRAAGVRRAEWERADVITPAHANGTAVASRPSYHEQSERGRVD